MTQIEFELLTQGITTSLNSMRGAYISISEENNRLLTRANGLTLEIDELSNRLTELDTVSRNPIIAPYIEIPQAIEMDTPILPTSFPVVRFLSRSPNLGGLANVKAKMQELGVNVKRLRLEGSSWRPTNDVVLINWGGGFTYPETTSGFSGTILNNLDAVKIAANKLKTFKKLDEEGFTEFIPEFTTVRADATWDKIYCRDTLYGNSGEGIDIHFSLNTIARDYPLYVEGLDVKHEYRVHVVGKYTKIQKKAALGNETVDYNIRNLDGGWTFINEFTLGNSARQKLHTLAIDSIKALGLDFGAVDIVRTQDNDIKILEVNTAPGVSSDSNIEWYSTAFLAHITG